MPIYYEGRSYTIELVDGALESKKKVEERVPGNKAGCIAQLQALTVRLADHGSLRSPDQFRPEGEGIFAIKTRGGLRAYGWFSKRKQRVFVISHYILKKRDGLRPQDLEKAVRNREVYESSED